MEEIQKKMKRFIERGEVAGISTLIMQRGKEIYSGYNGMLDKEKGVPIQQDSLFRVYSLSKPVTAAALMILVERGAINLEDPISTYMPEFKKMKVYSSKQNGEFILEKVVNEITIWHLLTHTAGLAYGFGIDDHPVEEMYQKAGFFSNIVTLQIPLEEMIKRLSELPLVSQPGTAWRYSIASDVIGHLIELVSEKPFGEFLDKYLFEPLGMTDTSFFVPKDKRDRFGPLYSAPDEGKISILDKSYDSPFLSPQTPPSGGIGLVSTVGDYSRFLNMLINLGAWESVQILTEESIKRMTKNQLSTRHLPISFRNSWQGMGYGLGFGVSFEDSNDMIYRKGSYGWLGISGVRAWVYPAQSASVVVMPQSLFYFDPSDVTLDLASKLISDNE